MLITWDKPDERLYSYGLDRGVLYITGRNPVPWNGLQQFDEGGSGTTTMYYRDGIVYLADSDASDFVGKMTAMAYPDAFGECIGFPQVTDGLFVDNQKPKRFGLSYRTLVGSGAKGDLFGYQIHLVYNCMATIAPRQRKTLGSSMDPTTFDFDVVCTPVKMTGMRPTAHYVIDTRNMSPSKVTQLENLIYGNGSTVGVMPDPDDLFDLMNFGDAIIATLHTDGTFTIDASAENVYAIDADHFQMDNIFGTDNLDGTYLISDGGTTDVIIE